MKLNQILGLGVLAFSGFAFAEGTTTTAPAAPSSPKEQVAATAGKMDKKAAKAACKAEGLKGKDLKACIKTKTM